VCPTYFIDYAVADNDENGSILCRFHDDANCDLDERFHRWCTPPVNETINARYSHAINLPIEAFRQKMTTLTQKLEEAFGVHPFSFRSGRWGINGSMLKVLAELGYRVDSSVRPFYNDDCFSYQEALTRPYWPSLSDCLKEDHEQRQILEIPASSGFNFSQFEQLNRIHGALSKPPLNSLRLIGVLWAIGAMRKITVTPEGQSAEDICRCMKNCVRRGDSVINMFFHSSDLLPGCTDYVKDDYGKTRFFDTIETCVNYATRELNAENMNMRQAFSEIERRLSQSHYRSAAA